MINFTCSADGNPEVHTYQLFENDVLVTNGSNSHGMWNRTMSVGGSFIYKCVANNTAGTGESESVNVTVNGEKLLLHVVLKHISTFVKGSSRFSSSKALCPSRQISKKKGYSFAAFR